MTLIEFLLARIGEQEAAARGQIELRAARYPGEDFDSGGETFWVDRGPWMCADPVRVLAECEAKRRIVDLADFADEEGAHPVYLRVLRLLAIPYADHPDFDQSWRP